jgi:hypothetical protein
MPKRLLSRLAISTLVVGGGLALGNTSVPASQDMTAQALPAVPDTPLATPQIRPDRSVGLQMLAFEHNAQVNMLLYTGRFGQGDWAPTRNQVNAIALAVKAGPR